MSLFGVWVSDNYTETTKCPKLKIGMQVHVGMRMIPMYFYMEFLLN